MKIISTPLIVCPPDRVGNKEAYSAQDHPRANSTCMRCFVAERQVRAVVRCGVGALFHNLILTMNQFYLDFQHSCSAG